MIGMILKNMRLSNNLSQKDLGKLLNLSDTTISSYERENSQADFDTIVKIAKICNFEIILKDKENNLISIEDMAKEKDY